VPTKWAAVLPVAVRRIPGATGMYPGRRPSGSGCPPARCGRTRCSGCRLFRGWSSAREAPAGQKGRSPHGRARPAVAHHRGSRRAEPLERPQPPGAARICFLHPNGRLGDRKGKEPGLHALLCEARAGEGDTWAWVPSRGVRLAGRARGVGGKGVDRGAVVAHSSGRFSVVGTGYSPWPSRSA
jgi:hypothetical protein